MYQTTLAWAPPPPPNLTPSPSPRRGEEGPATPKAPKGEQTTLPWAPPPPPNLTPSPSPKRGKGAGKGPATSKAPKGEQTTLPWAPPPPNTTPSPSPKQGKGAGKGPATPKAPKGPSKKEREAAARKTMQEDRENEWRAWCEAHVWVKDEQYRPEPESYQTGKAYAESHYHLKLFELETVPHLEYHNKYHEDAPPGRSYTVKDLEQLVYRKLATLDGVDPQPEDELLARGKELWEAKQAQSKARAAARRKFDAVDETSTTAGEASQVQVVAKRRKIWKAAGRKRPTSSLTQS